VEQGLLQSNVEMNHLDLVQAKKEEERPPLLSHDLVHKKPETQQDTAKLIKMEGKVPGINVSLQTPEMLSNIVLKGSDTTSATGLCSIEV
jgi:hypothetical protein